MCPGTEQVIAEVLIEHQSGLSAKENVALQFGVSPEKSRDQVISCEGGVASIEIAVAAGVASTRMYDAEAIEGVAPLLGSTSRGHLLHGELPDERTAPAMMHLEHRMKIRHREGHPGHHLNVRTQ